MGALTREARLNRTKGRLRAALFIGAVAFAAAAACSTSSREHASHCLFYYAPSAACPVGSVADALVRGDLSPPTYTDVSVDPNHPVEVLDNVAGLPAKKCCYAVDYTVNP